MSQTQTIRNKQSGLNLFSIATIVMMLCYILPQAVIFIRNDIMAIIVTFYYALFISRYVSPAIIFKTFLLAVPYLFLYWANGFPGNFKLGFVLPLMTLWTLVMPCFAIVAAVKRNNPAEQKYILIATGICLLYVFVSTFRGLAIDPLIMREMAGGLDISVYQARLRGVGGYGIAYATGALFIAICILRRHCPEKKYKMIGLLLMLICGLLVVQSQYATLLFITIGGIALYYIIDARTFLQKLNVVVASIVVVLSSQMLVTLGMSVFGEQEVLVFKFQLISDAVWGNAGVENVSGDRSQMQIDAFNMFLNSPVWGCPGFEQKEAYFASHSTILGVLASTGLIGIASYFFCLYYSIKHLMVNCLLDMERRIILPVFIYYLAFSFLNPVEYSFECSWIIFFVIPLLYIFFYKNNYGRKYYLKEPMGK